MSRMDKSIEAECTLVGVRDLWKVKGDWLLTCIGFLFVVDENILGLGSGNGCISL